MLVLPPILGNVKLVIRVIAIMSMRKNINTMYINLFEIMHGNWENWTMVLVEKYPCETSLERQKRERYWYEILGATLNKQVPNQTQQESKKQYRIENKKTIYEKQNQKHECDCGGKYTQQNKQRHLNSNKHQKYLQSLN